MREMRRNNYGPVLFFEDFIEALKIFSLGLFLRMARMEVDLNANKIWPAFSSF